MGEHDRRRPGERQGCVSGRSHRCKLRAYTIVVITEVAIITKAGPGRLMSFVVDRRSGDPSPA